MKNAHKSRVTRDFPCPAVDRQVFVAAAYNKYASFLRISGALHLGVFDQPVSTFPQRDSLKTKTLQKYYVC